MLKIILLSCAVIVVLGFLGMLWIGNEILKVDRKIREERGE